MRLRLATAAAALTILLGSVAAGARAQQGDGGAPAPVDGARPGHGATTPAPASPTAAPQGAPAAEGPSTIAPGIRVVAKERRIEVDALFEIVDPAYFLEYLVVSPQGKVHESLLRMTGTPDMLNLALILCNLEPKPEVHYQGEPVSPSGPRIMIEVEWTAPSGAKVRKPVEELIEDARMGTTLEATGFAYTGSRFIERKGRGPAGAAKPDPQSVFAAQASGSAIALYHDPDAVLDLASLAGGDIPLVVPTFRLAEIAGGVSGDERFRPSALVPKHGTPAVLHLRAR